MAVSNTHKLLAYFLNHDEPFYEMIADAANENTALAVALAQLRKDKVNFVRSDVVKVVRQIRKGEDENGNKI